MNLPPIKSVHGLNSTFFLDRLSEKDVNPMYKVIEVTIMKQLVLNNSFSFINIWFSDYNPEEHNKCVRMAIHFNIIFDFDFSEQWLATLACWGVLCLLIFVPSKMATQAIQCNICLCYDFSEQWLATITS